MSHVNGQNSPLLTSFPSPGPGDPVPGVTVNRETWHVLIVENDPRPSDSLPVGLRRHGHTTKVVSTGAAALREYHRADMVLIDLELPDVDGLEVCECIRSACDMPVLAVTSRDSELDRVLGLQAGADDYLVKPYAFRELLARMEAVMRRFRHHIAVPETVTHGALTVDAATRSVKVGGRPVPVTRKEFDLLSLLASRPGMIFSRRQILQQVWGDVDVSRSRTIDTHVNSLRKKLGTADWIVTVRGVGFRLVLP
ncbi:response regulator transcription factor [Streptomyces sp. NPDC059740]|uniref:response regulator transcription factor n=1 Tax=Streptomyces sp. NPDC059740 TaxID=3346926 RepID=UPI0036463F2B